MLHSIEIINLRSVDVGIVVNDEFFSEHEIELVIRGFRVAFSI